MEEKKTIQQETVSAFIDRWVAVSKPESVLQLKIANWNAFPSIENSKTRTITQSDSEDFQSKYDLIIGDLLIGLKSIDYDYHGDKLRISQNYKEILYSLDYLKDTGTALYILEPMGFGSEKGKRFEALLNKNGFFVSGYIRLPEGIFKPQTSLTPIIVVISKQKASQVFVDELIDPIQAVYLVDSFFILSSKRVLDKTTGELVPSNLKVADNIATYSVELETRVSDNYVQPGFFTGFASLKTKRQIERLQTQYVNYSQQTLGELAIEVNSVPSGGTFTEIPNSIYIPRIGKQPVVSDLQDVAIKHQYCFQVVLDTSVNNNYLAAFFRSALGKLILKEFSSETYISHLNKTDVLRLPVAIPTSDEQQSILHTVKAI